MRRGGPNGSGRRAGALAGIILAGAASAAGADGLSAVAALGKQMFFDPSLSASGAMSCAFCHDPANHYGPQAGVVVTTNAAIPPRAAVVSRRRTLLIRCSSVEVCRRAAPETGPVRPTSRGPKIARMEPSHPRSRQGRHPNATRQKPGLEHLFAGRACNARRRRRTMVR